VIQCWSIWYNLCDFKILRSLIQLVISMISFTNIDRMFCKFLFVYCVLFWKYVVKQNCVLFEDYNVANFSVLKALNKCDNFVITFYLSYFCTFSFVRISMSWCVLFLCTFWLCSNQYTLILGHKIDSHHYLIYFCISSFDCTYTQRALTRRLCLPLCESFPFSGGFV